MLSALGTASTELCKFIAFCKAADICKNLNDTENTEMRSKNGRTCLKEKYKNVSELTDLSSCARKLLMIHHWVLVLQRHLRVLPSHGCSIRHGEFAVAIIPAAVSVGQFTP